MGASFDESRGTHDRRARPPKWTAVIVDPDARSRRRLRAAVTDAGGLVVAEADDVRRLESIAEPFDVILGEPRRAGGLGTAVASVPVVLVTADAALADVATQQSDVMAVVLKPVLPAQLDVVVPLAMARFSDLRALERTLAERKIVERAKGQLMARLAITEEEAYRRLRKASMDARRPLVDVARQLITEACAPASPRRR